MKKLKLKIDHLAKAPTIGTTWGTHKITDGCIEVPDDAAATLTKAIPGLFAYADPKDDPANAPPPAEEPEEDVTDEVEDETDETASPTQPEAAGEAAKEGEPSQAAPAEIVAPAAAQEVKKAVVTEAGRKPAGKPGKQKSRR